MIVNEEAARRYWPGQDPIGKFLLHHPVAQRTREIGIRLARGATRAATIGMVLRFGVTLVAGGAVVGLLFAVALNAVLTKVFFGIPPIDAVPFAASAMLFVLVGLTACFVPVRRATRIDPLLYFDMSSRSNSRKSGSGSLLRYCADRLRCS